MKNYSYIQSLLGFGILKMMFFLLTILSFYGCKDNDKIVSEQKYDIDNNIIKNVYLIFLFYQS